MKMKWPYAYERTNVSIDLEIHKQLKAVAKEERQRIGDLAGRILADWINRREKRKAKK